MKNEEPKANFQETEERNNIANNEIEIISYEYIDNMDDISTVKVTASFGNISGVSNVGAFKINGISQFFDVSKNRYVSINPIIQSPTYLINSNVFNQTLTHSSPLNVKSNIGSGNQFFKNNNLQLTWNTLGTNEQLSVAICGHGSPCIVKTVNENLGSITIHSSEFSNFIVGNYVSVIVGKNKEEFYSNSSTLVNRVTVSSSTGHIIQ